MKRERFNKHMQKLMTNAWLLVKVKHISLSEAMKLAWKVYYIKTRGASGRVEFDYIKKSTGEVRHAVGTFNNKVIPASSSATPGEYHYTPLQIRYFDVDKQGWRSCIEDNIIAVY